MGLNAEIVDIDLDSCTLYVKDMDMEIPVFGEKCALDCRKAIEDKKIIYVNYEAENDMRNIEFGDLFIGDTIIISIYDSEKESAINGTAAAEQVQLATQRMN